MIDDSPSTWIPGMLFRSWHPRASGSQRAALFVGHVGVISFDSSRPPAHIKDYEGHQTYPACQLFPHWARVQMSHGRKRQYCQKVRTEDFTKSAPPTLTTAALHSQENIVNQWITFGSVLAWLLVPYCAYPRERNSDRSDRIFAIEIKKRKQRKR